jgi:septum site-determining protein MinD
MMKVEDVLEILAVPLLGIIGESPDVLTASNMGSPVTLHSPASAPAVAYMDAARRLLGEDVPMTAPALRQGLLSRLFGRKAAAA